MTDIRAYNNWPTNADLIRDVADLYLPENAKVLDTTWGLGAWWKKLYWEDDRVAILMDNDIDPEKGNYHHDVRKLPQSWHGLFDVVTFDPPYKLSGTNRGEDERYGIGAYVPVSERDRLLIDGARETSKCVKPGGTLWVKCADQVAGGKVHWQTYEVTQHLRAWYDIPERELYGLDLIDRFDMVRTPRPQKAKRQVHARRNASTLLIFRKPK